MVQNLTLHIPTVYLSNMSMTSSTGSIDSPSFIESDSLAFDEVPLTALSKSTRIKLSNLLNSKKILHSEEGYERDWRGLAALAKLKNLFDENRLSAEDPTDKVIQIWCSKNPSTATFAHLEQFLGIIDRWDVCDDIHENLVVDKKSFQSCKRSEKTNLKDVDDFVDLGNDFSLGSDANILTIDDVQRAKQGLPPQKYDAFVLFAEDDVNYAAELITKLEDNQEHNFKLCSKNRDLLVGISFEHEALTQLIEERCKHLIVILTKKFLESPENKFLVNCTQAFQIQHNTRKIIPLLYEDSMDKPRTLKMYTHLSYNLHSGMYNFWSKLANSIRNVNMPTESVAFASAHTNVNSKSVSRTPSLPSEPTDIPRIFINGLKNTDETITMPNNSSLQKNKPFRNDHMLLRSAHSTGQLHISTHDNNGECLGDITTKRKNKWPSKLKKLFNRSSNKLQEMA